MLSGFTINVVKVDPQLNALDRLIGNEVGRNRPSPRVKANWLADH